MRRTKKTSAMRVVALVVGVLISIWGVGTSTAQTHHGGHDDPGHHGGSSSSTTPGSSTTTRGPLPGERTTAIQYGPYTAQAAPPTDPSQPHGHWHSGNQFAFNVQKPCTNCYITGMTARLVGADRTTTVGHGNGRVQLHHMVLFNRETGKTDATCDVGLPFPLGLLFGQRFFASGDERTPIIFPPGYGYHVGAASNWTLIWDLASENPTAQQVYYEVKFNWIPDSDAAGYKNLEPIWFDVAQCGFSTFSVPTGPSQRSWTWTVNRPGVITNIGGHVHDGGLNIAIRNDTTGELICDSRAGYGETPLYIDHHGGARISSMSKCGGEAQYAPAGSPITNGQRITITGHYNMPQPADDQMAIVIGYVGAPSTPGPGPGGTCVRATNQQHVSAGRATAWLLFAWARGSNQYLGLTSATTSLREGPTGTWTMVTAC